MTKSIKAAQISVSRDLEKKLNPANDGDWWNTGDDDSPYDDDNNGGGNWADGG